MSALHFCVDNLADFYSLVISFVSRCRSDRQRLWALHIPPPAASAGCYSRFGIFREEQPKTPAERFYLVDLFINTSGPVCHSFPRTSSRIVGPTLQHCYGIFYSADFESNYSAVVVIAQSITSAAMNAGRSSFDIASYERREQALFSPNSTFFVTFWDVAFPLFPYF